MEQTLHFRIGEGFGAILMSMAQENLFYNYDIENAFNVLSDMPKQYQLGVLKGDYVLRVDEETQELIIDLRNPKGDKEFPLVNIKEWFALNCKDVIASGKSLEEAIDKTLKDMLHGEVHKSFDYSTIINFLNTGDKDFIIDKLMEDEFVSHLELLIEVVRQYLDKSMKIIPVLDWVINTFPENYNTAENRSKYRQVIEVTREVTRKFNNLLNNDLSEVKARFTPVIHFIKNTREIDKTLSEGIKPVDILQNYSAGWLAPNGDYYALNGTKANMLHNQIADALLETGIVPKDELEMSNPDAWLERNGWVKIHQDNVQFAGCLNERLGKKNVPMTTIQIKKICQYGEVCWGGRLKIGWKMIPMSVSKFKDMIISDPNTLNEQYFDF